MNFSQKSAVGSILVLLIMLAFDAFLIYRQGFERFVIHDLYGQDLFITIYLFICLRLPFMRKRHPKDTFDEYDRWVAYRAIMAAFIAFWVYSIAVFLAVNVHWSVQKPFAPVPVFYLKLVLLGGAFLMALVHAASVLFLYWHEARAVNGDRKK